MMKTAIRLLLLGISASVLAGDPQQLGVRGAGYVSGASLEVLREIDVQIARSAGDAGLRRALETTLIRMLQPDATPEAKLFACQRLVMVGGDTCLPAVASLLDVPESVGAACLVLAQHPSHQADTFLRGALGRLAGVSRVQVMAAIGTRRDGAAVALLAPLARDPEVATAEAAIVCLGRIGNKAAQRALEALRDSADGARRGGALDEAFLRLGGNLQARGDRKGAGRIFWDLARPGHASAVRAGAFGEYLRARPELATETVLRVLRGEERELQPDAPLRLVALSAAGGLASPRAPERLAEVLPGLMAHEQVWLLDALADLGPRAPRAAMATRLTHPEPAVRLAAVRAFSRLNDPRDIGALVGVLTTGSRGAEPKAVEAALVQMPGGASTDRVVLAELARASDEVKPVLIQALVRRGAVGAVPELLAETSGAGASARHAAWQGLGRLASAGDLDLLLDRGVAAPDEVGREDATAAAALVLGRMPAGVARSEVVLRRLERATDVGDRAFLVRLLPFAEDEASLLAARKAAQHTDDRLGDAGVRALADWPTTGAWEDLVSIHRESGSEAHRALAWRGLVRLASEENARPDDALVGRYRALLEAARGSAEFKLVLGALGGCARPEALALALAQWQRADAREEVGQAVRRIADAIKGTHPQAAEAALKQIGAAN